MALGHLAELTIGLSQFEDRAFELEKILRGCDQVLGYGLTAQMSGTIFEHFVTLYTKWLPSINYAVDEYRDKIARM
ncbi:hypothetical protein GCM10010174_61300 [Kutzneria viridogrisea]|uniref:Uncharacterized protein n=1 Tax=Kutzneria viridogrisea TaxID=47990 RepID=A0ABR6BGF5_9PSEU|nr:hypothetical protein [Kutzneria viridogrisea]